MTPGERFERFVSRGPDCWIWTGCLTSRGYGCFSFGGKGKNMLAHRFAYQQGKGSIPEGLTVDHLCGEKRCVNPAHLEAVTIQENGARHGRRIDVCAEGHPLSGENLVIKQRPGGRSQRVCLECRRAHSRTAYWKARAKQLENQLRGHAALELEGL